MLDSIMVHCFIEPEGQGELKITDKWDLIGLNSGMKKPLHRILIKLSSL